MRVSTSNSSIGTADFNRQTIMLVDDNEDDLFLMKSIFQRIGIPNALQTLSDGEEALSYFKGEGPYADRAKFPLPGIVLLDLNMPRKNGFEVLAWIRSQPHLRHLTVHILSASMRLVDVEHAFALGANSYLVKPSLVDDLIELMSAWHCVARHSGFAVPQDAESAPISGQSAVA